MPAVDPSTVADRLEITDLCARYAMHLSRFEVDELVELFLPDGTYTAFGEVYGMDLFAKLVSSAPRGQLIVNPPVITLNGDDAGGEQHYTFTDQKTHEVRLAWYSDQYRRTADGWRFANRSTTFLRRGGGYDSGNTHDPPRS